MAYNKERKEADIRMSNVASEFIQKNFYSKHVKKLEVITDKWQQVQGIDTKFWIGKEPYRCDEKAAVRYRNIKTFSFEISFLDKNDNEQEGWFINKKMVNELYLFFWIDKSAKDTYLTKNIETIDDIQKAEIALVKKEDIKKYLQELGWTDEKLILKARKLRSKEDKFLGDMKEHGVEFRFSEQYSEQPVNVLISRGKLRELAIIDEKYGE